MESNGSEKEAYRSSLAGGLRAGLLRRDFCWLLGSTAVALGFGLNRSLAVVASPNSEIAERVIVKCPEQHCVLELDRNGVEQSRYYQIGRHTCELRGRVVTLDNVRLVMPIPTSDELPYSPEEREFINRFTEILEQWCSEELTSQERDISVDVFAWEVELRF